MAIDICTFDKTWVEIPKQDNPAFDYKDNENNRWLKAILVCKVLPYHARSVGNDGYVVIYIPISGDVIKRGLFWNFEDAMKFAQTISDNE